MATKHYFFKFSRHHKGKNSDKVTYYAITGIIFLSVFITYPLQTILGIGLIQIGVWYYRNRKKEVFRLSGINEIDRMKGTEFEDRIKLLYEDLGYSVEKTPITGDFGADLIANKLGERIVIQCKRYSKPVGVKAVQEVATAVMHYKANKAMVITNNKFTENASKLAKTNRVALMDRTKLIEALHSINRKQNHSALSLLKQKFKKSVIEKWE